MNAINTNALDSLGLAGKPIERDKNKLGQEDFLKLMITQIQNQDPFKPMENGEFLAQMAQFGTVSGIDELQGSFESLAGSLSSNQNLQAAALVGRNVLVPAQTGGLTEDGSLRGAVDLPASATSANVAIYDASGELVQRIPLGSQPQGLVRYEWDGTTAAGGRAAPGTYVMRAEAMVGGESLEVEHLSEAGVGSVRFGRAGEQIQLDLTGVGKVGFSEVREIR